MRPCDLYLRRGRRYALLGQNGVGKTTLLTRVAAGDIAGFPAGVRCVYVQHEVLAQSDASVTDFMSAASAVPGGEAASADADVSAALAAVGFTDTLCAARVGQLSGGWRMRLALARSMLHHVRGICCVARARCPHAAPPRVQTLIACADDAHMFFRSLPPLSRRRRWTCCCWTSRRTTWT
jgi:ATPase subunit of ABC transporter with duplicated ATPase domains